MFFSPQITDDALDYVALQERGWVLSTMIGHDEYTMREWAVAIATKLGSPVLLGRNHDPFEVLTPTESEKARARSLSNIHALAEFPLHTDTAHWLTPCRYILLACVSPGNGDRPTLLLDTRSLPFVEEELHLLHRAPFQVRNGRNSFFSTILAKPRSFVRFDTGCMSAATPEGRKATALLLQEAWPDHVETIHWTAGRILILDNWRLLHGRGKSGSLDSDRKLLRISIR